VGKLLGVYAERQAALSPQNFPRFDRVERIREALAADQTLTFKQLERHFGAVPDDLRFFPHVTSPIEPVHMRRSRVTPTFVGLRRQEVEGRRPPLLAHNCGTAEGRLTVGASPAEWRAAAYHRDLTHDPDAVFIPEQFGGKVKIAVEYDRGTYSKKKIIGKLQTFSDTYDGVLWLVPPHPEDWGQGAHSRLANLRKLLLREEAIARLELPVQLLTVQWWLGEEETVIKQRRGPRGPRRTQD